MEVGDKVELYIDVDDECNSVLGEGEIVAVTDRLYKVLVLGSYFKFSKKTLKENRGGKHFIKPIEKPVEQSNIFVRWFKKLFS